MLINGYNLKNWNARILDKILINPAQANNFSSCTNGATLPILIAQNNTFNNCTFSLLIQGKDKITTYLNCSNLVQQLNKCQIYLLNDNILFHGILLNFNTEINNKGNKIKLNATIQGYVTFPAITFTMNANYSANMTHYQSQINVNNPGTLPSPWIMECMSLSNSNINQQFSNPVFNLYIPNMQPGCTYTFDCLNFNILLDSEPYCPNPRTSQAFNYPLMPPGGVFISPSCSQCYIEITCYPRIL